MGSMTGIHGRRRRGQRALPYGRTGALRRARRTLGREDGQVMFLSLFMLIFAVIFGLVAINAGMMYAARTSAQRAADAAALAGCQDLPDATAAGVSATRYGASSGGLNATTAVNLESGKGDQHLINPPDGQPMVISSGALSTRGTPLTNDTIRVYVQRTQGLIGLPSVGFTDRTIGAHAVCRRAEGSLSSMTALQKTGQSTLTINSSNVQLGDNGALICSSDSRGLWVNGGGSITGDWIDVGSNPPGAFNQGGSTIDPPPAYQPLCPDPYASVPEPSLEPKPDRSSSQPRFDSGCQYSPDKIPYTTPADPHICYVPYGTVLPGVYWGGLELGSRNGDASEVTLDCGGAASCIFHMAGGPLRVNPNTTVHGTGVTIFLGGYAYPSPKPVKEDCRGAYLGDFSRFLVSPPSSGTYMNLVLFEGRSVSGQYDCNAEITIRGGVTVGDPNGTAGVIYAPQGTVHVDSGGAGNNSPLSTFNTIVIANQIRVDGPVAFNAVYVGSGTVIHGDMKLIE